jgi:hypothetical protein
LRDCEKPNYDEFIKKFNFVIPDVLRYRYTLSWKGKELICNGITQKAEDGEVNIAGFSNIGVTMYSAKWQNGQFEIFRNNIKMPDIFLERSVLSDLLLPYHRLPVEGKCILKNTTDETFWLKTENNWANGSGYFVLIDNQPAWSILKEGKVYFRALASTDSNNNIKYITIENYKEGYNAQVIYLNVISSK